MKLVSVIIPTHFRPERLRNALESVLTQTWKNLEIIVVSDGYDESTSTMMESFKSRDCRIKFISYDKSEGGNHARNVGISASSGQYIAFLDDDDVWYPTKIECQMAVIQGDNNIGLVGCAIRVIYSEENIKYKTVFRLRGDLSKSILYENYIGSTSCVLLRKETLDKCGVFDEMLPAKQDHDLWIRICQVYKVDFVDSVQLDYYVHSSDGKGKQVSKNMSSFMKAHDILAKKYCNLYDKLTDKEKNILFATRYRSIAQRAYETRDFSTCREYAIKSLKNSITLKSLFLYLLFWVPKEMVIKIFALIK